MKNKYIAALALTLLGIFAVAGFLFLNKPEIAKSVVRDTPSPQLGNNCDLPSPMPSPATQELLNKYMECRTIVVFIKDGATDDAANTLVGELEKMAGVKSVEYISQDEALEIYKERNKNEPLLVESVTSNLLPGSIDVDISDPSKREEIINFAQSNSIVDKVIK